jgi:large subunit ribosomal protein L30
MANKARLRGRAKRKIKKEAGTKVRKSKRVVRKKTEKKEITKTLFAVVRVRGRVNVRKGIESTLEMLRLNRVNHCVVIPNSPSYLGMLHKSEECITWGEINQATLEKMLYKRGGKKGKKIDKEKAGEIAKKIMTEAKSTGVDLFFRLKPPSRGYKAIRHSYPKGALGYRGEKINELLKRMI